MSEHEHTPPIKTTGAKWKAPGMVNVIIRGESRVIPEEEAEELRDAIGLALVGPGPQVVFEVVERR